MAHLPVLKEPTKTLRVVSTDVPISDIGSERIAQLMKDMEETMYLEDGVGIAAPQVGVNERVIIVETRKGPEAFINPKITGTSIATKPSEEGCLSVPGVYGLVKRFKRVNIEAFNAKGEPVKMAVIGFPAIIFQHEIDHLDGVLFIDKAYKITKKAKASI